MSKFFSYDERLRLQGYLKDSLSFKEIGRRLGKDPSTISREVRKYSCQIATGCPGQAHNTCKNRKSCNKKHICGTQCSRRAIYCKYCTLCNQNCPDYVEEVCWERFRAPYICNGCEQLGKCCLVKTFYDAEKDHIKAQERVSESRSDLCVNEQEIERLNRVLTPLVQQGQSLHQIYIHRSDELMLSEKTMYNYVDACIFDIRNIDLPRKVRFRKRDKRPEFKVDKSCRIGRTYDKYNEYMEKKPDIAVVQMDSVIGSKGGKCLLTIHFVDSSFMLAYLRDANTSKSVTDIFLYLYELLGDQTFQRLFPVILTDNGSEFSNPRAIEEPEMFLGKKTRIFYCDAGKPYQKGAIEVNHELIRRVLPKGTSFDNLTQDDITRMMNHINSYKRKKLNNRSPYETFSFYHGEEILRKLGCEPVTAGDIHLKPSLLK